MKKTFYLIITGLSFLLIAGCTSKKEQLTVSTLTIAIEPGSSQILASGASLNLQSICKSAKSDNVDVAPTWIAENNLGSFTPTSGKTTVFTAVSGNRLGKIYASYADVRSQGIWVAVGDVSNYLFTDYGMPADALQPVPGSTNMMHYFDGGDGTPDNTPWSIDVQDSLSGCAEDPEKSMRVSYTDVSGGWGGFYLEYNSPKDMSYYSKLTFYARGDVGGEKCKIKIQDANGANLAVEETFTNTWQKIEIPLTGVDTSRITQPFILAFENAIAAGDATVYIDCIKYE